MTDVTATDVQAELQEYLNSKNINSLFIQIVERLLIEKPDNPIGFMVEYLVKKFPDEAKAAAIGAGGLTRRQSQGSAVTLHSHVSDEESEEEEEGDDDYVDDIEPMIKPQGKGAKGMRRVSVSAESVDPNNNQGELKTIPKTDEEAARILDILRENIMFKHLDTQQAQEVKNAMFGVDHVKEDEVITQGGDGDNFYVIDSGTIDVFIDKGGKETKIKTMGPGESFGELALMYSTPRTATCRVTSDTIKLWALDRISFKIIIMQTTIEKRNQYKSFLQEVAILDQLTEYEILTIADALTEETYEDGHQICEQGDVGNDFYIIKEGLASCTQVDSTGAMVEVAALNEGNYFGEIALMTSKVRQATVTAKGKLTCLSLDRKTFRRVMGPLDDILKRNMEAYSKIAAQNI